MKTLLIGCGLMGGSMVIDLRNAGLISQVIGVDKSDDNLQRALKRGFIDTISNWDDKVSETDLVILAIPVNSSLKLIADILSRAGKDTIVMDIGSTKGAICKKVEDHPERRKYVATHPIAGTENSGPDAAFSGLYKNKVALVCDPDKSSYGAVKKVIEIYKALGSQVIEMSSKDHDRHVAYVSHLSHISSFTLGLTVLDIEKSERNIHLLAGSGFDSTVRLAKSSPEMWEPIFLQNEKDITTALDEYIDHLTNFRNLIANGKKEELLKQMRRANEIRRILG
jgi:prephenate dehydrogenase